MYLWQKAKSRSGQAMVEYALVFTIVVIVVAAIASGSFRTALNDLLSKVKNQLDTAGTKWTAKL